MKSLAVRQPWACLLCEGVKTIEVRSWQTEYRGPLLITASAAPKNQFWYDPVDKVNRLLHAGAIIGVVDLIDCRKMSESDNGDSLGNYMPGAFAWVVKPRRWCRPDKIVSRLQLFDVPDEKIILLDEDSEKDWIFNYPTPQGAVKFSDRCPVYA